MWTDTFGVSLLQRMIKKFHSFSLILKQQKINAFQHTTSNFQRTTIQYQTTFIIVFAVQYNLNVFEDYFNEPTIAANNPQAR